MEITTENFEDLSKTDQLMLVKFGATWCGPCKTLEPIINALETQYSNVCIGTVDVDSNGALTSKFGINFP